MSALLKKLTISFLAFLVIFTSIAPNFLSVKAQSAPAEGTWYNQSFDQWYNKVYDENTSPGSEIFGERYTAAQVQWVIYSMFAFILNGALGNSSTSQKAVACFITNSANIESCAEPLKALIIGNSENISPVATQPEDKSLFQLVFADRPLSGISYVKERVREFKLVPEAYAQASPGFGFGALGPVQDMWRGTRNIAFGLFVIAAVALAFMIMFRVKISPQVVISIQSAIPKLVIALILVTFSYAIAGFMVDLMYVVIGLISLLAPSLTVFKVPAPAVFTFLTQSNIFWVLVVYLISFIISFIALMMIMVGALVTAGATAGAVAIAAALTTSTAGVFALIVIILAVIVVLIITWMIFKTVWTLLKAFANVLLLVIFGPIQIVAGVVISNFGFGAWLKSLVAALSTFVVTGALMLFSIIFLINGVMLGLKDFFGGSMGNVNIGQTILHFFFGTAVVGAASGQTVLGWPPLLGSGNSPSGVGLLFLGVSFVLFTLIPKAADIVQGFITGKPFAYGSAVGEALGPIAGPVSYVGGAIGKGVQTGAGAAIGGRAQDLFDKALTRAGLPPAPRRPQG